MPLLPRTTPMRASRVAPSTISGLEQPESSGGPPTVDGSQSAGRSGWSLSMSRSGHYQMSGVTTAHEGRQPAGNEELTRWLADKKRGMKSAVAGYEVVFAPPKSVSVAWALGDHDTRELIVSLHRQAVKDTLTHLESNAAFTRQGSWGEAQV